MNYADEVARWKDRAEAAEAEIKRLGEALLTGADVEAMLQARAEAAEKREATLREAAKPFLDYASLPGFDRLPDNMPMTNGSRMAARQVTAGDFKRLRTALEAKS